MMNPEEKEVSAPGKLILLGEYAVLEGAHALVASVDRRASVQWRTRELEFLLESSHLDRILSFIIDENGTPLYDEQYPPDIKKLRFFNAAFATGRQVLKERGRNLKPAHIKLDTSEFYTEQGLKMGFGSSAALTVSIIAAMLGTENLDLIYRSAIEAHRRAQGKIGSGIDIAASTWGGVISYRRTPNEYQIKQLPEPRHPLYIIPVWSGQPASTPRLVGQVNDFKKREPGSYIKMIDKLSRLSYSGIHAWSEVDIPAFLDIYREYGMILHQLGRLSGTPIFSRSHLDISEIVTKSGAVYKPSGAGGGDIGVALAGSHDKSEKTRRALSGAGFSLLPIRTASAGVYYE